ncbi:MAG: glycosyl hydrolase [Prevotella sp.]
MKIKINKRYLTGWSFIICCLAFSVALTSCSSNDNSSSATGLTVTLDGQAITSLSFNTVMAHKILGVNTDGDWTVSVPEADASWLTVSPHSGYGWQYTDADAENKSSYFRVDVTANPTADRQSTITVKAGSHTQDITVTQRGGNFVFDIAKAPVMPNATEQTVNAYNFLCDNFGQRVVTGVVSDGVMTIGNAEFIHGITGKYPVIHCFDFMQHIWSAPLNPTNWAADYTDMSVPIQWWKDGGLVSFHWHWSVPKSEAVKDNFSEYAFYSSDIENFNAGHASVEGTWENEIVKRDLDVIGGYLMDLQEHGVPVLWRPLHEADGAWFWWGNSGAENFKKLWQYMFNYFADMGLRNLIWVWTGEDADWYPGDNYVDVIGIDSYEDDMEKYHTSNPDKMKLLQQITSHKLFAITECGAIPSVESMMENGDIWSWATPWTGDATCDGIQNSADFYRSQYDSEYVITRDEMPNLK